MFIKLARFWRTSLLAIILLAFTTFATASVAASASPIYLGTGGIGTDTIGITASRNAIASVSNPALTSVERVDIFLSKPLTAQAFALGGERTGDFVSVVSTVDDASALSKIPTISRTGGERTGDFVLTSVDPTEEIGPDPSWLKVDPTDV